MNFVFVLLLIAVNGMSSGGRVLNLACHETLTCAGSLHLNCRAENNFLRLAFTF